MNIAERIDAALSEVTAAEVALDSLLKDLRAGARAEKVKVSDAVEEAFARLRRARVALSELREQVVPDEK